MAYVDDQITILNRQIAYQQQLLNDSDRYIVRSVELSQPVYPQITSMRAQARAAISNFQAQVYQLLNPSIPNPPDMTQEATEYPAGETAGTVVEQVDQSLPL